MEGALAPEVVEEIVSLADELRETGRQEGRQEGLQKGQSKMLLNMLRRRFGKLPAGTAARVRAAGVPELERWAEWVITARSVAEVLGG